MSFLTDLFKGNFGHLGQDIAHDPWGSAAAGIGTLGLGALALPALGGALGLGGAAGAGLGAAEAGAAGAGLAGGLTPGAEALAFAPAAAAGGGDIAALGGAGAAAGGDVLGGLGGAAGGAGGGGIGSGIMSFLSSNPGLLANLGIGLGGTLLAPKLSGMINKVPQQKELTELAGQEKQLGRQQQQLGTTLTSPLVTGQLPKVPSRRYRTQSMMRFPPPRRVTPVLVFRAPPWRPTQFQIQNQATQGRFAIAEQMAQTGLQATNQAANAMGLQDQIYAQLMNAQVAQDTALQQAIARMAAGAALGPAPIRRRRLRRRL